jgi:hypothetical protein
MLTNDILEEVRATKAALWQQANGDMATFGEQLREFAATCPASAPVLRSPEDLAAFVRSQQHDPALREDPPPYGDPANPRPSS